MRTVSELMVRILVLGRRNGDRTEFGDCVALAGWPHCRIAARTVNGRCGERSHTVRAYRSRSAGLAAMAAATTASSEPDDRRASTPLT